MKSEIEWEKIAERGNDFLKNYLVYEAIVDNFKKVFSRDYMDFLTLRKGQTYVHYLNKESSEGLIRFILSEMKKDPQFMEKVLEKGKKKFDELIDFCRSLKELDKLDNTQLLELLKKYFRMYKEPYPYFLIAVEGRGLGQKTIDLMAKIRLYGRASYNKSHEISHHFFEEIGKRVRLRVEEVKFLKPFEIEDLLSGRKINVKNLVTKRDQCVFIHKNGEFELHELGNGLIEDEIKGQGTFPGFYKGKVKLISNIGDVNSLEGGEVIVLRMTTTDLISEGLKRAGAIVTDEGGITCHAAILSREFNIPTLIGTKIATKVFKDGDLVEVDAEKGVVRKL